MSAPDLECNVTTIVRNNTIFAKEIQLDSSFHSHSARRNSLSSSIRNSLLSRSNSLGDSHQCDSSTDSTNEDDEDDILMDINNESLLTTSSMNDSQKSKSKHRLLFRDVSIQSVVIVRTEDDNKVDSCSDNGTKLDPEIEENGIREGVEEQEQPPKEQEVEKSTKKNGTMRRNGTGTSVRRKKLVKGKNGKKKILGGRTDSTDSTKGKKKKIKIKLLKPDEEGYLEQQHRRLTKKIAANKRKAKHEILDTKSRIEFAQIQSKEYTEMLSRLEIIDRVIQNTEAIFTGSAERKALQQKLQNRKALEKLVETNNKELMGSETLVVRGGTFCKSDSFSLLADESGHSISNKREDIVIVRVNDKKEETLITYTDETEYDDSSSSSSSSSSDDDDETKTLLGNEGGEKSIVPKLLSIYDDLQEECLLLKEHNEEMKVQLKIYHDRYCRIAKERKKLKKSMDAILEYNNKYMTMAGKRSLTSDNVQNLVKFAEVTRKIKLTIDSCYDNSQYVQMITKLKNEFGVAPSTRSESIRNSILNKKE